MQKNKCFVKLSLIFCSLAVFAACGSKSNDNEVPTPSPATTVARDAFLTSKQISSSISSTATGTARFVVDPAAGTITGSLFLPTMVNTVTAAHIHDGDIGSSGGVIVGLTQSSPGVWTPASATLPPAFDIERFKAAGYYVNVHTSPTYTGGEIRGQLMSYADNIQPIFNFHCIGCHQSGGQATGTGLFLTSGESYGRLVSQASTASTPAGTRVIPFNADQSILYKRISGATVGAQMPLGGPLLSSHDKDLIHTWIDMGALND
jgi:hypothetical protein